jgi:hypothetical protein
MLLVLGELRIPLPSSATRYGSFDPTQESVPAVSSSISKMRRKMAVPVCSVLWKRINVFQAELDIFLF